MKKTNNSQQVQVRTSLDTSFRTRMKIFSLQKQISLEKLDVICLKKGFTEIEKSNEAKLLNILSGKCDRNQHRQE